MPSVETHSIEEAKMDGGFDDLRRSLREMHWMEEVASKRIEVDFFAGLSLRSTAKPSSARL